MPTTTDLRLGFSSQSRLVVGTQERVSATNEHATDKSFQWGKIVFVHA